MTAADSLKALEQRALAIQSAKRWALCIVILLAFGGTYCAGRAHGVQSMKDRQFETAHAALVDTIRTVETRYVRDTVRLRIAAAKADTARARFDTAAATVEAIADTSATVPSNLVLPALHACAQAIEADTIAYRVQAVALADMVTDRDLWKARALLDEGHASKPPRFGLKTGIAIGAAAVALVVRAVR